MKELQTTACSWISSFGGLGWYDYVARYYDASVGRWNSVDPLADHPNQVDKTPYSAFWNNPIMYDDPDGQCPICPWLDAVVKSNYRYCKWW